MSLFELFSLIRRHLVVMIVTPIVFGLVGLVACYGFMPESYSASSTFSVVEARSDLASDKEYDSEAVKLLVNDVATLVKSDRVVEIATTSLGVNLSDGYFVESSTTSNSRVVTLTVGGPDPNCVALLANEIVATVSELAVEDLSYLDRIDVINTAAVPTEPSGMPRIMYVIACLMAGLFVALVFVMIRDLLDTKIRDIRTVEKISGSHVVGALPVCRDLGGAVCEGSSPDRRCRNCDDAADVLLANVCLLDRDTPSVIAVAGLDNDQSAEHVSYLLAKAIGKAGKSVVLLDCNVRGKDLSRTLASKNEGLLSMCSKEDFTDIATRLACGIDFIGVEEEPVNPVSLFASKSFSAAIKRLSCKYDYVVLCAPPINRSADSIIICALADSSVISVKLGCVDGRDLEYTFERLSRTEMSIAGICVMNDSASCRS